MKKLVLYTFIDGFGWEVYKRHQDFLSDLIVDAKPLKTTFGFSSGADPSILTGRYPDEHTHWSSFYYNPEQSPFKWMKYLRILPKWLFESFRVRHLISKCMKKIYGYTGYFEIYSVPFDKLPYFDYLEKKDYFVPGGILKTDTIFDELHAKKTPYHCSNWRLSEKENLKIAKEHIQDEKVKFIYLYLPQLDGVMHNYGTYHENTDKKISWLDREIREVYLMAKEHYDEVELRVFSDHGMHDVIHGFNLMQHIDRIGLDYGNDYIAMYDSTMARFWFKNERSKELIINTLNTISTGSIVSDEELKKMHVFFEDYRFGELFFLMDPGIMINPSYFGKKMIGGMHGYHPDDPGSNSIFLSTKKISESMKSITDIRSSMHQALEAS